MRLPWLFKLVAEKVGLIPRNNEAAWWVRHPLAFLVEAADDICYHIIDLEDSYRMKHISFKKARKLLNSIACLPHSEQGADSKEERIKHLRALAINNLVVEIAQIFCEKEESMLDGTFDGDLLALSKYKDAFAVIKKEMQERVYNSREVVSIEIAGYEVLGNLFSEFVGAVVDSSEKHSKSKLVKHMLPKQCRPNESEDCYSKMLKITDYISGMTDSYATTLFQKLKGISLS